MRRIFKLAILLLAVALLTGGEWTTNKFLYKPSLGASGQAQKNLYDTGMDRVDARLGNVRYLGDQDYTTLAAALSTIGATETTLVIPAEHGSVALTDHTTIPSNVQLIVLRGAYLSLGNYNLTINGPVVAGPYRIFNESGTGATSFANNDLQPHGYPEWWGDNTTPGTTDMTAEIQAAVDSVLPKIVFQGCDYLISSTVGFDRGDIFFYGNPGAKITGADMDTFSHGFINAIRPTTWYGSSLSLTSDADEGDTEIVLDSVSGLAVGDYIIVGTDYEPHYGYAGELHTVQDISGSTVTLDRPLEWEYTTARSSFAWEIFGVKKNVRFEGIIFEGPGSTATTATGEALRLWGVANCQITNCTFKDLPISGVCFMYSTDCTIRDCHFEGIITDTAGTLGNGYCVRCYGPSHNVVADGIHAVRCGKLIDGSAVDDQYGWISGLKLVNSEIQGSLRGGFSTHDGVWDLTVDNVSMDQYTTKQAAIRGRRAYISNLRVRTNSTLSGSSGILMDPYVGSSMASSFVIRDSDVGRCYVRAYAESGVGGQGYSPIETMVVRNVKFNGSYNSILIDSPGAIYETVIDGCTVLNDLQVGIQVKANYASGQNNNCVVKDTISDGIYIYTISGDINKVSVQNNYLYNNNSAGGGNGPLTLIGGNDINGLLITGNYIESLQTKYCIRNSLTGTLSNCWIDNNFLITANNTKIYQFDTEFIGYNYGDKVNRGTVRILGRQYYSTIAEALSTIGSTDTTLVIPAEYGEIALGTTTTVPANVRLRVENGAYFTLGNYDLNINGPLEADRYQIFDYTGTGVVSFSSAAGAAYPEWWGAVADWNSATQTGTDDVAALEAACAAHTVVDLGSRDYTVESTLNIDTDCTIISNGATIHFENSGSGDQAWVVQATGTIGSYSNLASNAVEGSNRIEQATIAAAVSPGDLLLITSSEEPLSGYYVGEMQTVLKVSGDYIYLSGALNDSYSTANTGKVAIVSPIQFNVRGCLRIRQYPASDSQKTDGIDLIYTQHTYGRIEAYDCTQYSIVFHSCFAPDIEFYTNNSHYTSTGNSYGLAIDSATMDGRFRGTVHGARHGVMSGAGPSYPGRAWNNHVYDTIVYGLHDTACFDAHVTVGSIYYNNCTAIGGDVYNKDAGTDEVLGFVLGARDNYLINCTYFGVGTGIFTRGDATAIRNLVVDGFNAQTTDSTDVDNFVFAVSDPDTGNLTIDNLVLRNIYSNIGRGIWIDDNATYTTTVSKLVIENIYLDASNLLLYSDNTSGNITLPTTVVLTNCSVIDSDNSHDGINATGTASFSNLILNNVRFEGQDDPVYLANGITRIELNNCHSLNNNATHHVRAVAGNITDFSVMGGHFADATTALLRMDGTSATLSKLTLVGSKIEDAARLVYFADAGATLAASYLGPFDGAIASGVASYYASGYLEYYGGSQGLPTVIRGSGTPESVVTAPPGCLYLSSAGGSSTTLYIKESGTGNTGWVAK